MKLYELTTDYGFSYYGVHKNTRYIVADYRFEASTGEKLAHTVLEEYLSKPLYKITNLEYSNELSVLKNYSIEEIELPSDEEIHADLVLGRLYANEPAAESVIVVNADGTYTELDAKQYAGELVKAHNEGVATNLAEALKQKYELLSEASKKNLVVAAMLYKGDH